MARPVTPLAILAARLGEAVEHARQTEGLPEGLGASLEQAHRLAAGLDPYLNRHAGAESPALAALVRRTAEEDWGQRFDAGETVAALESEMLSGHLEGQVLKMLIRLMGARRVLEIGMFTGYSALAMAEALPADGEVVACELDPFAANLARAYFAASPDGGKVRVALGPALDTLQRLARQGACFDLVFVDADKPSYADYFRSLLDQGLVRAGGLIGVDNTLYQGQVYLPSDQRTANGRAIAEFNELVAGDPRVEQVILPLRDGLSLIRVIDR
jgi:caffeoyl-CoA O-methyltransferase